MATSGVDRTINIFDVRTYKPLQSYRIAHGANELHFSQTGLLAAASNNVVEVMLFCMFCLCFFFFFVLKVDPFVSLMNDK